MTKQIRTHPLDIGVVTDEISLDLAEALERAQSWGISRVELREGEQGRFPFFTPAEISLVEGALQSGAHVTAVSPGLFKGPVDDQSRWRQERDDVLPRAIEQALRFAAPVLILFGFERVPNESSRNRTRAMRVFEHAAEAASDTGLIVALENEPNFWIDDPSASVAILDEIGHPALKLNWDPANVHWGGRPPTYEDFLAVEPHLVNLHVKDFSPEDSDLPWTPIGRGTTPWTEILPWIIHETDLPHVTLETHCTPRIAASHESLANLRDWIEQATEVES